MKGVLVRMGIAGVVLGGGIWAVGAVQRFLAIDPFASMRPARGGMNDNRVVTLRDVRVRQYEGPRLAGEAKVGAVAVTRDRRDLQCETIREGIVYAEQGEPIRFTAGEGVWRPAVGILEARYVHLWNKEVDLRSARFIGNQRRGRIEVPVEIQGRFFDGQLLASSLSYSTRSRTYVVQQPVWSGQLALQENPTPNRRWQIKAERGTRGKGDTEVWLKGEATDGEVIVRADRIERNPRTDVIVATGNVRYFGLRENLLCEKVTVYRRERRAVMEGKVNLFLKPDGAERLEPVELQPLEPIVPESIASGRPPAPPTDEDRRLNEELRQGGSRRKYPTTVIAARIEYWYGRGQRRAVITGSPQARQDLPGGRWRQFWAHRAEFDGERESLRASSRPGQKDVRVRTSIGDDLRAVWFLTSTAEGDDSWEGEGIEGVVYPDEDEIPRDERRPPPTPPGMRGRIGV